MSGQINFLHHQIERLLKALNDHGIQIEPDAYPVQDGSGYPLQQPNQQDIFGNAVSPPQGRSRLVNYQGPAGSDIAFDMPLNGSTEGEIPIDKALEYAGTSNAQGPAPTATMSVQVREDPIWSLDATDAERLFSIYEEEVGKMYPIIDLQEVHQKSTFLFKFLAASKSSGLKAHFDDYPNIARDINANITKMVLANALTAESGGQNELGKRLFQSVLEVSEKKLWEQIDGSTQILLTLMVSFPYYLIGFPGINLRRLFITFKWKMSYRRIGLWAWSLVLVWKRDFRIKRPTVSTSKTIVGELLL